MTQLTRQKIFEKLENLKEYLGYLNKLKAEAQSEEEFVSDFHVFGNTERYLQLSIQSILDIAHLIIIDLDLKRPDDNYEAVSILYDNKVVSESLASKLAKMVGLRNILVHEYGKIDRKKVYEVLTTQTGDLEEFQNQIVSYLQGIRFAQK